MLIVISGNSEHVPYKLSIVKKIINELTGLRISLRLSNTHISKPFVIILVTNKMNT